MSTRKYLPMEQWPQADRAAFEAAYHSGNIFEDDVGPGSHLAAGTRAMIQSAYGRWLGFLQKYRRGELKRSPADRITHEAVQAFIEHFDATVRDSTISITLGGLLSAARLIAPQGDWSWLRSVVTRLEARAETKDRFDHLVPPWQLLDYGIELMESADVLERTDHRARQIQYRDGLIIALLSIWPIRRRSLAALTVAGHLEIGEDGIAIVLHAEDTKSGRPEHWRVPAWLLPYFKHYLDNIRPLLGAGCTHNGLWGSYRNRPLTAGQIFNIVRRRIRERFGKTMSLHDFRRAAATFIAMEIPDKVGLIPGVLQHTSPEVGEQHYNLARSAEASRRHAETITDMRQRLRLRATAPQR